MRAKNISRRKRALITAAVTLPLIFSFTTGKAADPTVNEPFQETEDTHEVETIDPAQSSENPIIDTTPVVETPIDTKTETPKEIKTEAPAEVETKIPDDADRKTAAEDKPESSMPAPEAPAQKPEPYRSQVDTQILEYYKQFDGKTIVDIEYEGASNYTLPTVKAAVLEHIGDTFSGAAALRDRNALINTGYFYEAYQTFEIIPEGVVVTFHVLENPVLTDIVFKGNTLYDKDELEAFMTVRRGDVLNSNTLHDNIAAIQEDYHEEGFVLMKITDLNIDKDGVLTLKINEGILEGYAVKGNKKTKDKVILREMRQEVGTPFNAKLARRSMQRVYNLGFFEDVNIKMNPGVEPNAIIMEINVKEKRTGTFGIGAGYSSADGIIGMISISDTNFHGTGDTIALMYEKSGDENDAHGYNFTYKHPWLDHRETAVRFQLYNRTYAYNDYDTHGDFKEEYMRKYSGGEFTFSRPVSEYSTNFITIRHRKDKYVRHVSSGNAGNRSGWDYADWRKKNFGVTRSIILEHVTDTRDNIYNPTTGNRVNLSLEVGGLFGGDFDYQKASLEHQHYIKAGDHEQVWALRGMVGYGHGDLTEFNKFRLGGQGSLRGYRDDQFRGDRMILGTLEYRFPLAKKIQGALFTDWGGVWDTGFKPKNIKGSIGLGLALNTPMGPFRLDYGRGSQGGRFHFSIGTSF